MLRLISVSVDHVKSPRFRRIDEAKLEGVIDGLVQVPEIGIAETIQAQKLQHLACECSQAPAKIGRYDGWRLGFGGKFDRYSRWRPGGKFDRY